MNLAISRHEKVKSKGDYLEFDWLLEDRGASRGFVLCPETILGHHAVAEGRNLEKARERSDTFRIKPASSTEKATQPIAPLSERDPTH